MKQIHDIISPVTGNKSTLIESIPVSLIIENYKKLLDIDVKNYFGGLSEISIYQCDDTGFRFYYPDSILADESFYAFLQTKSFYYSNWNWEHKVAAKKIKTGSRILEVGCGTGSFIMRMQQKGFDCTGLELNEAAVNVCNKNELKVYKELLNAHLKDNAGKYDVVCAFQVLEHVYDVNSFIDECLQSLRANGKLILGVPNNNPYFYKYDKYHTLNLPPHHAGLWSKNAFQKLPSFFPMSVDSINIEPLFNRDFFLTVYSEHKNWGNTYKRVRKIGPGIINRLTWPLRLFNEGKTIVAIFNKN